eukprot:Gb_24698 [translate_table: standard]
MKQRHNHCDYKEVWIPLQKHPLQLICLPLQHASIRTVNLKRLINL